MKKIIVSSLLLCSLSTLSYSQQDSVLRNKNGRVILPEQGEVAIGIGANSIFNYVGNMFSSAGKNELELNLLNNNYLYGKYFINEKNAIRAKLSVSSFTNHHESLVPDQNDYNLKVTDKIDFSFNRTRFDLGYERRKGTSRLQLAYGAEISIGVSSEKSEYTYGNAIMPNSYYQRPLLIEDENGLDAGIRAFAGVEYFVFPKISLGGEFGIGYSKNFNRESVEETERWDYSTNAVKIDKSTTKNSTSNFTTDNLGGQLYLLFHF